MRGYQNAPLDFRGAVLSEEGGGRGASMGDE